MASKTSSKPSPSPAAPTSRDVRLAVDHERFFPRQGEVLRPYLDKVRVWHGYARFIGLPALVDTSKDVPLERLYVPPRLSTGAIQPEAMNDPGEKQPPTLDLLDSLLEHPRLIVLGDPGSGKSTLINFIADSLSRSGQSELRARLGADLVPLPFILRELGVGDDTTWESLCAAFLGRPVGQTLGKDDTERRHNLDTLLSSGQGWVMLDGLDEIGSVSVRKRLRDIYLEAVGMYSNSRFLLTSRIVGFKEVPFDLDYAEVRSKSAGSLTGRFSPKGMPLVVGLGNFEYLRAYHEENFHRLADKQLLLTTNRLYLAPFNDEQVRAFTRHWWMHHRGNPALAAAEAEEFLAALHAKQDTRTLARVPNLLVLIALVYKVFVKLPDGRAELYWKIAEAYLENIDRSYDLKQRLPYGFRQMAGWLGHVAWQMQLRRHQEASEQNKDEEAIDSRGQVIRAEILITHAEALTHLTVAIQQEVGSEGEARILAATFLDYAARRSGLFIPRGVDIQHQELYAFMHLSFQEFFCAVYLQQRIGSMRWWEKNVFTQKDDSESCLTALRQYAARVEWTEVFIFLFEMLQTGDPDRPADFLRALLREAHGENQWRLFDAPFPETSFDEPKPPTHPPVMSQAHFVEVVAALAMDSEVRLAPATREQLLHHAWDWEIRRCEDGLQFWIGSNAVARLLTARRADLSASWRALASLGPAVHRLSLSGCTGLSDLQPLQGLVSLQLLKLSGCTALSDLQPLQELASLLVLDLSGCTALSDLRPLQNLSSLQFLYLSGCITLRDIQPLQKLASLQDLNLSACTALSDIQPLQKLASLQDLNLSGCTALSDLQPLQKLASLQVLNLSGCTALSDLQPLQNLASLQFLNLSGCTGLKSIPVLPQVKQIVGP